jgi:hypothetical protein
MSHQFESPTGREDPRLSLGGFYLFEGRPGSTVMAMTVNPGVDAQSAPMFREEGIYAFRFGGRGDGYEEVSFKVRFPGPAAGRSGRREQRLQVLRAADAEAGGGRDGVLLVDGETSRAIRGTNGVTAFAGNVQDVFVGNAASQQDFAASLARGEYKPEALANRENFFASRHVDAIVLEVPNELVGTGLVHAWSTVSVLGHATEQQVARCGLPLIADLFLGDDDLRESYNRTPQSGNNRPFLRHIANVVRHTTTLAGTASQPEAYADRVVDRLGLLTLPYLVGSQASFDFTGFNGRSLQDDVMGIMLSLMANTPISHGTAPDPKRIASEFPYFTRAG